MSLPNGFDGVGRFTAVLFPVFISLAMLLRSRAVFVAVCVAACRSCCCSSLSSRAGARCCR